MGSLLFKVASGLWSSANTSSYVQKQENQFTFCGFPFLLSAEAKRRLLNSEAALEQQQAAQRDMMRQIFHGGPVMPYLFLQVDRANLLQSTLTQIGQLDGIMLKKQLKVQFVGEEGVDEGGVKKEFFQLLIAQVCLHQLRRCTLPFCLFSCRIKRKSEIHL